MDELATIRRRAMDLLARREHSCYELQTKLKQRGFAAELIQQVITALATEGLVSDACFAEEYIRMRANRGFGPIRIAQELAARGVAEDTISNKIAAIDFDWQQQLQQVLNKKFANSAETLEQRAKQQKFLLYRGFSHDDINKVV